MDNTLNSASGALLDNTLPNPDQLLNLDQQMCFALYSASLSMTKVYKPLLTALKLTYPQYLVLLVLWEQNALTVNSLGERLFLDSGTLTPLLKRLEKLGFISRQRDSTDERRVIVSLTSAGTDLRHSALQIQHHVVCSSECSVPKLEELTKELTKLRTSLIKHIPH